MKSEAIKVLKTEEDPKKKFTALLSIFILANGNPNLLRAYNSRGYRPESLETLIYDVKKHLNISNADIRNFQIIEETPATDTPNPTTTGEPSQYRGFENILREMNDQQKEGLKLHSHYPFLREPDCPDEFKILVNDAITAFYNFKESHEELFHKVANAEEPQLTDEEIFKIADLLLQDFHLNKDIHAELEHYQQHKEILGEHPIFSNLKLKREVEAMSAEELAKTKNNIASTISKKRKQLEDETDPEKVETLKIQILHLETKKELVNARLKDK